MDTIINKIKEIRKDKNLSHEAMAFNLGISQAAYSKIEQQETKLTVERLYKIADILGVRLGEILEIETKKIYQQEFKDHSTNYQEFQTLHQENKETFAKLLEAKDEQINLLKAMLKINTSN